MGNDNLNKTVEVKLMGVVPVHCICVNMLAFTSVCLLIIYCKITSAIRYSMIDTTEMEPFSSNS